LCSHRLVLRSRACSPLGFVSPKCGAPRCHAEEHRSGTRTQALPRPKSAAVRLEACGRARAHPSRHAHVAFELSAFLAMRAPQDEDGQARSSSPNRFSVVSISRCQTAHLVPAARFLRPGFLTFASLTRIEGERSAERRSGACEAPVGHAIVRQRRA
jgi:hypothetical protein